MRGAERLRAFQFVRRDIHRDDGLGVRQARPCTTLSPTPPQPKIATELPGRTSAVYNTAPTPVMTPQPIRLACGKGSSSGTGIACAAATTVCVQNVPTPPTAVSAWPSAVRMVPGAVWLSGQR